MAAVPALTRRRCTAAPGANAAREILWTEETQRGPEGYLDDWMEQYDTIIVGAGHNGLGWALTRQRRAQVLVLEAPASWRGGHA